VVVEVLGACRSTGGPGLPATYPKALYATTSQLPSGKTGAHNRLEAARTATTNGWL
jgi:hypothetical protein